MSLYKDFKFTERAGFQFRAESFNTWNHPQFTGVGGGLVSGSASNVGLTSTNNVTATYLGGLTDPREFQFGGRFYF